MFRLLLYFLGIYLIIKFISSIISNIKTPSRGNVENKKKREGEVGEGWIVEDRMDENKKADS